MQMPTQRGIFLVVDGTDGSGKATQTGLLVDRLRQEGHTVQTISFPQYGLPSAHAAEQYLAGAFGGVNDVSPYRASVFFAIDRHAAAPTIVDWLAQGHIVVADRYVSSNMGHQASKIDDPVERQRYLDWNEQLEYDILQLPRPDITFILHVPSATAQRLAREAAQNRFKIAGDIHEHSAEHLERTEATYRAIAARFPGFVSVECVDQTGTLRDRAHIHEEILSHVKRHPALASALSFKSATLTV